MSDDDDNTEHECRVCHKEQAEYACVCGNAHYCSEACQKTDWAEHSAKCNNDDESDDEAVRVVSVGDDVDAAVEDFANTGAKRQRGEKFNDQDNQIDFASEYRNIFEALYDIRDAKGNPQFDWFVDILNGERSRDIVQNATDQEIEKWWDENKDSTTNFTGFIPTNEAIARWAVEIGYAEPESSEFTGDVTGIDNILRADTIQNIVDDNETRLIILNHLSPDILPPKRGLEGIDGNVFRGFSALPRTEALEPLGPQRQQDLDQVSVTEDIDAFNKRYGQLEIRKVFENELADRRADRNDPTLSEFRIKFKRTQITADIRFDESLVTRAQNAYIYGIDRVLAKPPRFLRRAERNARGEKKA